MDVIITNDSRSVGVCAANIVADEIRKNPELIISFPTGSSPIACYEELVRQHKTQGLDFRNVYGFNMDEYVPLPKNHPQSCYYFMQHYLYQHTNISPHRLFAPDATAADLDAECRAYTQTINKMGGFDLIILGIGRDGHITFNMPSEKSQVFAYVEELSEKTIQDNARFFGLDEQVPTRAITLGMHLILNSKKVVLVADGEAKSEAIGTFLNRAEIASNLPASFLWIHQDVTIILDRSAAQAISPTVRTRSVVL